MVDRIISLSNQSFFLFGPRGSGKTTLLKKHFTNKKCLFVDLLDPLEEDAFIRNPHELEQRVNALPKGTPVIIDEVQKAPRLLETVHKLIESKGTRFILTGSSARKLKRGAANLLAGRAFVFHLHPFTYQELGSRFDLPSTLHWGSLPKLLQFNNDQDKMAFLRAYALTYLKEEIAAEQLVRKLDPFREFLEIAARSNGQILNFTKIADDVGVDIKTVQSYYSILEDTLTGFFLPAYHRSVRKRQHMAPKFYLFDLGVKRALDRTLTQSILPKTYGFGKAFEHFIITECIRLNDYFRKDWRFFYLHTKDGAEIDLIIDRPGNKTVVIEIKSTSRLTERDVETINRFAPDFPRGELLCLSLDPNTKKIGKTSCLYWKTALDKLFK